VSLATRHRPQSLEGVVGQREAVNILKYAVKNSNQHSFLFAGPSGVGKTTLARIMAHEFTNGDGTPANLEEIPAADHTGVDAMRAVVHRLQFRAIGASPIKAVILDECHRLSGSAWDVLLKPIEEPPSHVYWFLCTTEPGKIPKTIHTRCSRIDLKSVPEDVLLDLLASIAKREKLKTPDEVLEAIAEGAGGSPRQALVFLETCGHLVTAAEARLAMRSGGQNKEAIDLCRFLVKGQGQSWVEAMKLVKALDGVDAESVRITLVNYLAVVLINTKENRKAAELLRILDCFMRPYLTTDRAAPLLHSLGLVLGLDR
jgi:DNA polymerase III gamma/tau subunit